MIPAGHHSFKQTLHKREQINVFTLINFCSIVLNTGRLISTALMKNLQRALTNSAANTTLLIFFTLAVNNFSLWFITGINHAVAGNCWQTSSDNTTVHNQICTEAGCKARLKV